MSFHVYLSPNEPLVLHTPVPKLPIILIPGIMGTRLADPRTDDLVWNPLGWPIGNSPGQFHVDFERLQQLDAELVPDESHLPSHTAEEERMAVKWDQPIEEPEEGDWVVEGITIRHYNHIIPDFYGDLAKALSKTDWLEHGTSDEDRRRAEPVIYCCGYDWRQDNARSALRLASIVEEALRETGASKVILVAHSMGGLIARYYCRVLGGEEKVASLFLMGSPTQGAPSAYTNLKHGIPAVYGNDLKNDIMGEDVAGAVDEIATAAGDFVGMIAGLAAGAGKSAFFDFIGKIYLACCLGAGKMLSRQEMVYFARQVPSLYQLLPTSTYCRDHKTWLFFDPMASGVPPTGYLIKLPTTLALAQMPVDAAMTAVDPSAARTFQDQFRRFTSGEAPDQPNEVLLSANSADLAQLAAMMSRAMDDEKVQADLAGIGKAIAARIMSTFIDCRDRRMLYEDVYTGFMDRVDMRAISAGNVALSHRFDDALRVKPSPEAPLTAKDLILPLLLWATPLMAVTMPMVMSEDHSITTAARGGRARRWARMAEAKKRDENRLYMPKRTVYLYCNSLPTDGGSVIIAKSVHSSFDANQVQWQLLGKPVSAMGDGTVPTSSARPPDDIVSKETTLGEQAFNDVVHADLPKNADVIAKIKEIVKEPTMFDVWWPT